MSTTLSAPDFALPGVDGVEHSLSDYSDADALVLIQSCNHCPYVQAWEGRIKEIASDYAGRNVRVVAINSNDASVHANDSFDEMVVRAREEDFNFDYLHDEDQSVARALESSRTPEVFLFDRERKLVYRGAIDDSRDETKVTKCYVRDALDAVLDGRSPDVAETESVGCGVKWLP